MATFNNSNGSMFCNIPDFCASSSPSPTRVRLAGRKRPRSSGGRRAGGAVATAGNSNEVCSEDEMTSLVASELNKLTFQERETVYEDVHAISATDEHNNRSEEDMRQLLQQTREHIAIIRRNKQAYNRAVFLNPEYVDSDEFLSLFLIGEKFQPPNAAKKVVDHFSIKSQLFAPHLLAKKITFQDLDDEDKRSLKTGSFQPLGKDKAGRTVVLGTPCHIYKIVENQIRAMWYLFMKMTEDPSTKRNGMVCVYYLSSSLSTDNRHVDFYYKSSLVQKGVPFVVKGFHFCYDNEIFRPIMSAMQLAIGNQMRLRFRSHYGSTMEVQYSLQTFGISRALFPLGIVRERIEEAFQGYLLALIEKEAHQKAQNRNRIMCPTSVDVLLGRGRHPQEHQGNLNLAKLVDGYTVTYATTRKQEKKGVHISVVHSVKSQGGRFLKRGPPGEGWEVVPDDVAIDKVRNRFREAMSNRNPKTK